MYTFTPDPFITFMFFFLTISQNNICIHYYVHTIHSIHSRRLWITELVNVILIGDLLLLHTSIHKVWLTFLVRSSRPTLSMWPLGTIPKIANITPYFKNMLRVLRVNFQESQFWIGTHIRKFEIILMKGIFFSMVDLHTWYENMCYGVLSFTYKRAHVLIFDIHTYVLKQHHTKGIILSYMPFTYLL